MLGKGVLCFAFILGTLALVATPAQAARDFQAVYELTKGKQTTIGVIRVQQGKYRLDIKKGKKRIRVIVDPATNLTVVADMRKRQFRVMTSPQDKDAKYDPFAAARLELMRYVPQAEDPEEILGYRAEKTSYLEGGRTRMSAWNSPRLDFPLKVVSGNTLTPRYVLQLKEIEEREFKTDIFELPRDLKLKPEKKKNIKKTKTKRRSRKSREKSKTSGTEE